MSVYYKLVHGKVEKENHISKKSEERKVKNIGKCTILSKLERRKAHIHAG